MNDSSHLLEGPPWQLELLPTELGQGSIALKVEVTYADGSQVEVVKDMYVDLGEVSWGNDISPLNDALCISCHGGNSATLLASKSSWIEEIEGIITMVELEAMPQGGPPLTTAEIAKIKQWRDAGFP